MSFSYQHTEDSPGYLLWQLANEWQRNQRQALAKLNLTHVQFLILAGISWLSTHSDEPVTQQHIVKFANIDKMMVSTVVQTLVQKKFLKRVDHKHDYRSYTLTLTQSGHKKVSSAIPVVEKIDADFFNAKTKRLVELNKTLKKLLK
ncbi:MAG: MarR family winged helix-turn-helix transcriptional regulator [Gammaproteobacteria bacterium]